MLIQLIKRIFSGKKHPGEPVRQILDRLPEDFTVFDGMLYNHSEIDHVIFNSGKGLFIVNSIPDKGEIAYNGSQLMINRKPRTEPIKRALRDTFWLKTAIREHIGVDVHVTPFVVSRFAKVKIDSPILGVSVIESSALLDAVTGAPGRTVLQNGVLMVLRELHGVNTVNNRNI